jgi:hypothetical protein
MFQTVDKSIHQQVQQGDTVLQDETLMEIEAKVTA